MLVHGSQHTATPTSQSNIAVRGFGSILIKAQVNGQPATLVVDTGSARNCCYQALSQLCAFCSPDRRKESAKLCYRDFATTDFWDRANSTAFIDLPSQET